MKVRAAIAFALRESRGARGRLMFFAACLALGVAAIVGVAALIGAIGDGIRTRSRELLGADVSIQARRELPVELDEHIAALGDDGNPTVTVATRRTDSRELTTMARNPRSGASELVELTGVGAGYPLYGEVLLDPPGVLDDLGDDRAAVGPELLRELGIALGDRFQLGDAEFTASAVVIDEPGRLGAAFQAGPRVFTSLAGLGRTGLLGFGSRVRYRALVAVPPTMSRAAVDAWAARLEKELPGAEYLNVETASEAQPTIRRSLQRIERYLALAALLSLVLGGVGVAQIVRAWVATRTQAVAVMRALGFRPREVLLLFATHVALLAALASFAGAVAGTFLPFLLPALAPELLPRGIELSWEPWSIVRGTLLGVAIALAFAIPPLTAVWRVAPARVLRAEVEPLPAPRVVTWSAFALVAAGVLASAWVQAGSFLLAAAFTGGVAVAAGLLALGAFGLTRLADLLPRAKLPVWLVHGTSALARPGAGTRGAVVALGLGVLVVAATALIEQQLSHRLRTALPADAPTVFLLDVQPDQWSGVEAVLQRHGADNVRAVPVVTARLTSIDDIDVGRLAAMRGGDGQVDRPRWVLTREQRLTWMRELPTDNLLVEGKLWSDPATAEVSLEQEFAADLGAQLGSVLRFDVQGVPVELTVTSIRTVEWESFSINFFLVAEPGALEKAPHALLGAARIDAADEQPFQDELARTFANVTPIRVRTVLEKVMDVLGKLAVGVRMLGGFTIAVGLLILAGVASAGAVHRGREVALLKALGVRRITIAGLFATEFGLLGLVAGIVGGIAAAVLAWVFLDRIAEAGGPFAWWAPLAAAAATAILAAACGLLASARALSSRPIETLRG